jgi:acylphosphatase
MAGAEADDAAARRPADAGGAAVTGAANGKALLVSISGRVQGVSFRFWTQGEAEKLGLSGWVRNEPDGSVKALIAGPDEAVATMLERFWQGPRGAVVSDVVAETADAGERPAGFRITG